MFARVRSLGREAAYKESELMTEAGHIKGARDIFDGVASNYEGPAQLFGLFQYRHWHRELVATVAATRPKLVLDMCTGTGAIAAELLAATDALVIGADLSPGMLGKATSRPELPAFRLGLVAADARMPPFRPAAFDAVVFSYLLRYVQDVPATIAALGALVRPGGVMASLEFGVPRGAWHPPWLLYTRAVLPAGLAVVSPGWRRVGSFLGRSISEFYQRWPLPVLEEAWREAGLVDVQSRSLSLGGGVIMSGTRAP